MRLRTTIDRQANQIKITITAGHREVASCEISRDVLGLQGCKGKWRPPEYHWNGGHEEDRESAVRFSRVITRLLTVSLREWERLENRYTIDEWNRRRVLSHA